jgi:Right handed beta helix region
MKAQRSIFILLALILFWLPLFSQAQSQLWSGLLAPARAMDWTQAGAVPGSPDSLPDTGWSQCGSTLAAGSYNGTSIASTLASCPPNTYYQLGPGTFNIGGSIGMPRSGHVALRGSGASATKLSFSGGFGGCNGTGSAICISGDGTYPGGPTTAYNWTAGYSQGATQITLSSVNGIVVNQTMLVLNQCDTGFSGSGCTSGSSVDNGNYFVCSQLYNSNNGTGCGANGPDTGAWRSNDFQQEIVTVTAINAGGCGATCVTISHPLIHPNWSSGQSPQAVLIQPVIQDGVENMTLDGLAGSNSSQTGIGLQNALQCWVSGVEISNMYEFAVYALDVSHITIKDSYFFHSNGHPDAYAIRTTIADGDLIQNNIIQQWKNSFANDGPAVGEVIAYNFSVDQIVPGPSDFMWGSYWTHSAGDDFMLREGNAGNQAQDDNVHGTHLNQTSLRNFFWGFESCINSTTGGSNCGSSAVKDIASTAFIESSGVRYANNVGNVLGTPGFTTIYQTSAAFGGFAAWNIGGGNGVVGLPTDPLVGSTMLRWGNWDVVNNAALFCTGAGTPIGACPEDDRAATAPVYPGLSNPSTTIPASFYLRGKPAWFGSVPWPAIGPDVSGGNVGQCGGTIGSSALAGLPATSSSQCAGSLITTAWRGHVNANPAMNCFLNVMGGPRDGSGGSLAFDASACYGTSSPPPAPPTGLSAVVQ